LCDFRAAGEDEGLTGAGAISSKADRGEPKELPLEEGFVEQLWRKRRPLAMNAERRVELRKEDELGKVWAFIGAKKTAIRGGVNFNCSFFNILIAVFPAESNFPICHRRT